jgi:hypothetical protein
VKTKKREEGLYLERAYLERALLVHDALFGHAARLLLGHCRVEPVVEIRQVHAVLHSHERRKAPISATTTAAHKAASVGEGVRPKEDRIEG